MFFNNRYLCTLIFKTKKLFMKKLVLATLGMIVTVLSFGQSEDDAQYRDLLGQDRVNTITTAVPFLMIAPDARSGAMGDAGVASTPDANSMHWNPAKYAFIESDFGGSLSYNPWLRKLVNDISLTYFSAYYKLDDRQTLAFSLLYFSLGNITFTNENGDAYGTYNPSEFSIDAAYALKLSDDFSGAIAGRFINSNLTQGQNVSGLSSKPGISIAADVSAYYQKDIQVSGMPSKLAAGVNISNIGNRISYTELENDKDFIPTNLRLGTAFTTELDEYNSISAMIDFNKLLVPTPPIYKLDSASNPVKDADGNLQIYKGKDPDVSVVSGMFQSFSDAPNGFKEELREITYSIGLEYWYAKQFALRTGYFNEHQTKGNRKYFTLGAGLKYNIIGIDFAYLIPTEQQNPLENTLRFSIKVDIDKE